MTQSRQDVLDIARRYIQDEDVTFMEALQHYVKLVRMELTLSSIDRLTRRFERLRVSLNSDLSVLRFRKELKDL
jgi:hypothetical protein